MLWIYSMFGIHIIVAYSDNTVIAAYVRDIIGHKIHNRLLGPNSHDGDCDKSVTHMMEIVTRQWTVCMPHATQNGSLTHNHKKPPDSYMLHYFAANLTALNNMCKIIINIL